MHISQNAQKWAKNFSENHNVVFIVFQHKNEYFCLCFRCPCAKICMQVKNYQNFA